MVFWKSILLLVILFYCRAISTTVLYRIVTGNLEQPWTFNVTLFAKDLKGVVLYCVDSNENKLSVRVTVGLVKRFIQLSYNNAFTRSSLHQTCGCDPCDHKTVNLFLELKNKSLSVMCNRFGSDSLTKSIIKDNIPQIVSDKMKDSKDSIFLGMGNVDGTDDLIGCLNSFWFNKTEIKFKESGAEFIASCKPKCTDDMCSKGKCGTRYPMGPFCDCSSTPFNGRFCNRALREYNRSELHSYQRKNILQQVQFKVSWIQNSSKIYCLLELIYESGYVTILTNDDYLMRQYPMKDREIISPIISKETNFINVNITNSYMTIKILDKSVLLELPLFERFRVNIGYSEKQAMCEPFLGKYDFRYNKSQMIRVPRTYGHSSKLYILWIIIPIFIFILLLLGLGFYVRYRRLNNKSGDLVNVPETETEKLNPKPSIDSPGDDLGKIAEGSDSGKANGDQDADVPVGDVSTVPEDVGPLHNDQSTEMVVKDSEKL